MTQRMVLSLGAGSYQTGFQTVTAQLWRGDEAIPIKFSGALPALVGLEALYQRWQQLYRALYERLNWRRLQSRGTEETPPETELALEDCIEFDSEPGLNRVSTADFQNVCQQLGVELNRWLQSAEFLTIDQRLRMRLDTQQPLQVLIETDDLLLRRLPWHLWNLLEACPQAYVALSSQNYERVEATSMSRQNLRILAILGHSDGIDIQQDRQVLEQLPQAEVVFLTEPSRAELDRWLWHPEGWDILFFAGHSSSQRQQGELYLNPTETLAIEQLRNALRAAIRRGLHLAIFNSCDGLGLARDLEDLDIPQLVVMREPVPDLVAQTFLRHFLQDFSSGDPFFAALRQAQEKLQGLESEFPCASWLPTLCQNPSAASLSWPVAPDGAESQQAKLRQAEAQQLAAGNSIGSPERLLVESEDHAHATKVATSPATSAARPGWSWRSLGITCALSLSIAGCVMSARALGRLLPLELWSYDRLLLLQPDEDPDDRLLLVEVNEEDLRQYGWPLSDEVLAQLLNKINAADPRAVGLDIFRDLPQEPGHADLQQFWQENANTIAICLHGDVNNPGVPPPPQLASERVGFNDVPLDANETIRRQLWAMGPRMRSDCTTQLSFGLQLALRYLEAEGVAVERNSDGSIQLGSVKVNRLPAHAGGYGDLDGYQTMLRYRRYQGAADSIIQRVCIEDVLEGRVSEALIRDRVVLIGLTATSIQDSYPTPYGEKMRGVMIHAQMVSQILSAALDGRALITVWPLAGEMVWVCVWSLVGGGIGIGILGRSRSRRWMLMAVGLLVLVGASAGLLQIGIWAPLVPAGSSMVLSGFSGKFLKRAA